PPAVSHEPSHGTVVPNEPPSRGAPPPALATPSTNELTPPPPPGAASSFNPAQAPAASSQSATSATADGRSAPYGTDSTQPVAPTLPGKTGGSAAPSRTKPTAKPGVSPKPKTSAKSIDPSVERRIGF